MKILVLYFSGVGSTRKVAELIQDCLLHTKNCIVDLYSIENCVAINFITYDAFIIGTPVYHGAPSNIVNNYFNSLPPLSKKIPAFIFNTRALCSCNTNRLLAKLYNQGTMTFYAHENVENLGVYIFSCSFTRALICGKIIINDVVSVQPQKEIEMKTTDINKVRYTNRWRIVYGICNN